MSSTEKKVPLFIRLIGRFFTRKWENSRKASSVGKAIKTMKNEEDNFLFI